jgi:hypothetical protein
MPRPHLIQPQQLAHMALNLVLLGLFQPGKK